jgi:hypothetical protein
VVSSPVVAPEALVRGLVVAAFPVAGEEVENCFFLNLFLQNNIYKK